MLNSKFECVNLNGAVCCSQHLSILELNTGCVSIPKYLWPASSECAFVSHMHLCPAPSAVPIQKLPLMRPMKSLK